ncbi:MAG: T9SS type A sorting domain-containing protein, partial [Polaribacter sp.]|nr:T9SS type A sorting domain-containing protein [Polaribacter sp.]
TTAPEITDCDDTDAEINPNTIWYVGVDDDQDGFIGAVNSVTQCDAPDANYTRTAPEITDCDDFLSSVNPNAIEILENDIDDDCNPETLDTETLDVDSIILVDALVSPNPFKNTINITLPLHFSQDNFNIFIYDLNGRLVFQKKYSCLNGKISITNLNYLKNAFYVLKLSNIKTGASFVKMIVKY